MNTQSLQYAGFWLRLAASTIDTVLLIFIIMPILLLIHGPEHLIYNHQQAAPLDLTIIYLLPIIGTFLFWKYRAATPGKIFLNLVIVDTATSKPPSNNQLMIRYLGYVISSMPFFIGFLWIGFDKNKQGWHDKMAGTVVLIQRPRDLSSAT